MALLSFFLFLSITFVTVAQQNVSTINRGSSLTTISKSMWLSPSGRHAFGFYPQSNGYRIGIFLVGASQKTVVWTANRNDDLISGDATLESDTEGVIILQVRQNRPYPLIDAQSASSASMLYSGNFVLHDSSKKIIWQSFDHPTDTIVPGGPLVAEANLLSSLGN